MQQPSWSDPNNIGRSRYLVLLIPKLVQYLDTPRYHELVARYGRPHIWPTMDADVRWAALNP